MRKRVFDICFSLAVLVLLFPLFVLIAVGIALSSPGSIFYRQERLGRGERRFKCWKFRSMHIDADRKLIELLSHDPLLKREWEISQKLKDDPRIFPLGKFLRKTSLDELPQFWNVLKGDLSVVGPRPYMIAQREELGELAHKILSVKPGVTGLWQTSGRNKIPFQGRIELDARYVDRRSFFFDLYLIGKTIPAVLMPKDAY